MRRRFANLTDEQKKQAKARFPGADHELVAYLLYELSEDGVVLSRSPPRIPTHYSVCEGATHETASCVEYSLHHTDRQCGRDAKWLIFPNGPGFLNTTQFSNLYANVCDECLPKALRRMSERFRKEAEEEGKP